MLASVLGDRWFSPTRPRMRSANGAQLKTSFIFCVACMCSSMCAATALVTNIFTSPLHGLLAHDVLTPTISNSGGWGLWHLCPTHTHTHTHRCHHVHVSRLDASGTSCRPPSWQAVLVMDGHPCPCVFCVKTCPRATNVMSVRCVRTRMRMF